ncbi:hypothetical protein JDF658_21180 [Carboxydocella sp. JDF658]|nr:hypothetical protein JDF658_21180 [Carboxydocella sp. JDF658]
MPRLRARLVLQPEKPGVIRVFLRLEGAGGRERGLEHFREEVQGISHKGE